MDTCKFNHKFQLHLKPIFNMRIYKELILFLEKLYLLIKLDLHDFLLITLAHVCYYYIIIAHLYYLCD